MLKAYLIGIVIAVMVPAAQGQEVVLSQEQKVLFSLTATLGALQAVQRELLVRIAIEDGLDASGSLIARAQAHYHRVQKRILEQELHTAQTAHDKAIAYRLDTYYRSVADGYFDSLK